MSVPNIFAAATGSLALSQLDTNFATPITLGSTTLALGSTVTSVSGLSLVAPALGTPITLALNNAVGLPLTTGVTGTLPVTNGGTGVTSSTGTGSVVLSASPTFTGTALAAAFTLSSDLTTPSLNSGYLSGRRNRIINGGFAVDQRNSGAAQTVTTAGAYTVDRWQVVPIGASVTGQRIAGSAPSQYRYRLTGAASVSSIFLSQRIESANSFDLAGRTITVSVDLANSLLTTVTWAMYYANSTDVFTSSTLISTGNLTVNSAVTRYSFQVSVPSAATTGLQLNLSVAAQTSGTWTIGDAQLEPGSVATPFERQFIGTELFNCQRYYCTMQVDGQCPASGQISWRYGFPATMRVAPTISNIVAGSFSNASVLSDAGNITTGGFYFQLSCSSANGYVSGRIQACSSEL